MYTLKSKNFKNKKNSQGECGTPTNVPKLGASGVKDRESTAKTNKDLGMSCYIQVEYSVFFPLVAHF